MYKCSTVNNRAAKDNTCINAATVSNHQSRLVFKKKTRPRSDEWLAHHLKQRQSGWTWWYVDSILLIESIDQLDRHKAPLRREREREKASREREKESKMITLDGHLTRPVVWYWRGSGQRVIRERAPSECVSVCSLKCVCLCVWIRACVCVWSGGTESEAARLWKVMWFVVLASRATDARELVIRSARHSVKCASTAVNE